MKVNDIFRKVEKVEQALLDSEFISPVVRRSKIRVRVLGLIYEFRVRDSFEGWAILKPVSPTHARVVGSPNLMQISEYLKGFLKVGSILCQKRQNIWYGTNQFVDVYEVQNPILLADGVELFDEIIARFDGQNCWFEMKAPTHDPAISEYLRQSLSQSTPADKLQKSGLTPSHKKAYQWQILLKEKKIGELTLDKIKRAVDHGSGQFKSYIERNNSYTVIFSLAGEDFRTTVRKDNFEVLSAGICLSGEDKKFDLQSLVSVVKEGQEKDKIHREGGEE